MPDTLGSILNSARVYSDTLDMDNSNDLATATTAVDTLANVSITKTAQPTPSVLAGNLLSYTLTVANAGPSVARNVAVLDTLSSEVVFQGATIAGPGTCALQASPPNTVSCHV